MTRSQFAYAIAADEKWVENSARLLGRRLRYTREEALWLGMVRALSQEVGLTLLRSAEFADEVLSLAPDTQTAVTGPLDDGFARVCVDLARYRSSFGARLSAALMLGGERRRGRRPRAKSKSRQAVRVRAARYGVDVDLLREGLRMTPGARLERLDENAAFIRALRTAGTSARSRGL